MSKELEIFDAIRSESLEKIKSIITRDPVSKVAIDESGYYPMHVAADIGFVSGVELLISEDTPVRMVDAEGYGKTPLYLAASNGNTKIARLLLDAGSHVNAQDFDYGMAAIHLAARGGFFGLLQLLLSYNVFLDLQSNSNKYTALHYAAEQGYANCTDLLLRAGANPLMKTFRGETYDVMLRKMLDKKK